MTTLLGEDPYYNLSDGLVAELAELSDAIDGQELAEAHAKTIREGWARIGELNDARDTENGVSRDVSHVDSIALVWQEMTEETRSNATPRSAFGLHDQMVKYHRRSHRTYILDIIDEAAKSEGVNPQAAEYLKNALNLIINAYDLTSIARDDLSAKIKAALLTVSIPADLDLHGLYYHKLGVGSQRFNPKEVRSNYPQILRASGFFEGLAANEISKFLELTGATAEVEEIKALLKAGYYLTESNVASRELLVMRRLRIELYSTMMRGQTDEALRAIEEMILTKPSIATRATYALLGFSDEDRDQMIATSKAEITAKKQARKEGRSNIVEILVNREKERYSPWLDDNMSVFAGKVCELLDDNGEPTGQILQFNTFRGDQMDPKGRPAIPKFEFDIYEKPDGTLVFARHTAGYLRATFLAKMVEEGTIIVYDSLADYSMQRLPGIKVEEVKEKVDSIDRSIGETQRFGGLLVRASSQERK